ncbi:TAXI family TRAP transporter solute-binding subunit [Burkholderia ubonensis]|uniref:TAXI family TRAP transporter solute-binding subunit n=1 Tax=Burkholderia ubonensis TaxID=101571 RepID=UPI000756B800|nr:TAXI family TRAP transporter solute-binding subunit [Burkholderia ubonensis]KVA21768.1 C4-dicarboxylate ABC transporter substrate-binding protein [Burkholderia ubonensis]KVA25882.1 C4-dicarboxylate ABC transporter substrate-binding protein [Burkholderia ubonensis]KVA43575.1 C4-dicarboxylate ABC transporter substrate-binding protein [Burkholderia ubonensis]
MPSDHGALRRHEKPPASPVRRYLVVAGTALILAGLGWVLVSVIQPALRHTIVMTTGADNGIYRGFADRYAAILKRDGITLDIRSSSGSIENYERLTKPDSEYEVGFIQSGTTTPKEMDHLQTIAAVSYEPIWVFYRGSTTIDRLSQLRGKRIGIGVPGSGLLNVSLVLLGYSGITRDNTTLEQVDAATAYQRLEHGELDAAFFIGRPDAPMQQTLLNSDLKLMSFAQADALAQKFPSLSKIVYPRASTSVADDRPQADVTLLAATALLVAKDTLHPAFVYLLLDVAKMVHGHEDYFTPIGTFPNLNTEEFPIADESTRYFKSGRPFLQRYLPFWLASFIERRLLVLVPFAALLLGLLQALPRMVEAHLKKRLLICYGELKLLDDEIWANRQPSRDQIARWNREIDDIDAHASQMRMPKRYFRDLYALKQAIGVVRERISTEIRRPASAAAARGTERQ